MDVMYRKNSEWQAREQNLLSALLLDVEREQMEMMRHLVSLSASERSSRINEVIGTELASLRNKAIGQ